MKKNDCEIFQLEEGLIKNKNFHCPPDEKLILIKAQIKSISTKLLSKENRYENTHFAFSEEITLLHDLNQSLKEMTFLLNPTLSPEIKVNYLKEEIRDRTIELSKWKEQEKAIFNIPEKERQKTRITKDAEELYKKGIELLTESLSSLKSEKLAESQKLLEQARDSLKTFLLQVLSDNPLESILQMVILDYEDALIINPLIEQPLLELQLALQDVEKVGQKFSDKIKEHLAYTRKTQQLSLEALKQNKPETATIFLREGYFAVQEALDLLKTQKDQTPINVLKYGLQEQKQAEELVSAAYKLIPIEGISPDLTKTLIHGQMDPINAVKDFISTVLLQEKTIFIKHGQDPEKACQDKPWDEVIPLFQQGYETAQEAYQELQSNNPPWTSILQNQQNTIISWQMAIDKMAAHESESKQKQQQQQQQQEQNPPPTNNPPGNEQPLSIEQKMRLLEHMEQEDKIQPLTHPPTSFKEVKPW